MRTLDVDDNDKMDLVDDVDNVDFANTYRHCPNLAARGHLSTFVGLVYVIILIMAAVCAGAEDTFKIHPKWFQVGPNPSAIVAPDLNGDGLPEIVTASRGALRDPRQEQPANNEVTFLVAGPGLDYVTQTPLRADFAPYAIAVGNVDALKALDLVVASFLAVQHRDLALFLNMGNNLFESHYFAVPQEALVYKRMLDGNNEPVFTKPGLTSLALADVNHDGLLDVIATGWSSDVLAFFPGKADGYFGAPVLIDAAGGPCDVKAVDLDGDKNLDLAVVFYCSNEIGIWKGDGKGNFTPATRFGTRGRLPNKVQVSDINKDGKLDLVVSHCYTEDSLVIFYGDGGLGFSLSQEILLGADRDVLECEIRDLVVADFNGDGRPDLAAACYGSGEVVVLINTSEGEALPQTFKREKYVFENGKPRALCAADFNKDGRTDLGVALWDANAVALLLNKPPK